MKVKMRSLPFYIDWQQGVGMKSYMCVICGYVYEEEKGRPEDGIPPGTRWEDVPENWKCPDCGAAKSDFEMIQI
jgi:rubredoxin